MQKRYVGGGLKGHTHRGLRSTAYQTVTLKQHVVWEKNYKKEKKKPEKIFVKNCCTVVQSYVYSAELFFPKFFVCFIEKFDWIHN